MKVIDLKQKHIRAQYHSIYKPPNTVIAVHEAEAIPHIHRVIKTFKPELMIETGTGRGGMTLVIHESCIDVPLHTFDIKFDVRPGMAASRALFNNNVVFHEADLLKNPVPILVNLCKDSRKKVLYCDNGDKVKEFKMYAVHLNSGDLLGVHDWGKEIKHEQVEDVLKDFEPVEQELFRKWTTRFWKRM